RTERYPACLEKNARPLCFAAVAAGAVAARRAPRERLRMRINFNELPQTTRERFLATASREDAPGSLLRETHSYLPWVPPILGVLALGGAVYALLFVMTEAQVKAPYHDREIYLALAGALFVGLAGLVKTVYQIVWKNPAYRRGSYLFPSA